MKFFDSHAHYYDEQYGENADNIINEIYKNGITNVINVGASVESSKKVVEQALKYDFMYAAVGIHPEEAVEGNVKKEDLLYIKELAQNKKVVAIGEIGLDYHYDNTNKNLQAKLFKELIEIANQVDLPIIIHNRDSNTDLINILKNEINANKKGVFHCCQMNIEFIKQALELDYYISFAGAITFKNAKKAKEVVEFVPLEKLLIETDAPYLAPDPYRGTINSSINVKLIAQKIAEFKNIPLEKVANTTYNNTTKLFEL